MITGAQVRMARAALQWGVRDLAERAGVSPTTVAAVEAGKEARSATLAVIEKALTDAGAEFTNGDAPGVRLNKLCAVVVDIMAIAGRETRPDDLDAAVKTHIAKFAGELQRTYGGTRDAPEQVRSYMSDLLDAVREEIARHPSGPVLEVLERAESLIKVV